MGNVASFLFVLIEAALFVVGALLVVPAWRSRRNQKWWYLIILFWQLTWLLVLERLFALVSVPFAWQIGIEGVLFALMITTLVLLYRHRHDLDIDVP